MTRSTICLPLPQTETPLVSKSLETIESSWILMELLRDYLLVETSVNPSSELSLANGFEQAWLLYLIGWKQSHQTNEKKNTHIFHSQQTITWASHPSPWPQQMGARCVRMQLTWFHKETTYPETNCPLWKSNFGELLPPNKPAAQRMSTLRFVALPKLPVSRS